jgi:hypothetical protein
MHEHARRGRRDRDDQGEPRKRPPEHALIALQRTAGNRAVQRLVYNESSGNVSAPQAYADQRIPWDRVNDRRRDGDPNASDPSLLELSPKPAVKGHLKHGLNVDFVNELQPKAEADMRGAFARVKDAALRDQMAEAAVAHNRLLKVGITPVNAGNFGAQAPFVMRPIDMFPETSDLPGVGADLRDKIDPTDTSKTAKRHWENVCTIIALYKRDGIARVRQIVQNPKVEDTLDAAVQAMHDHYIRRGVDYDDTSTRFTVMNEWGYHLVWAGESSWRELRRRVNLVAGHSYIFDIEGHTVMVRMKRNYTAADPEPEKLADVFEPLSDGKNYSPPGKELTKTVLQIWDT